MFDTITRKTLTAAVAGALAIAVPAVSQAQAQAQQRPAQQPQSQENRQQGSAQSSQQSTRYRLTANAQVRSSASASGQTVGRLTTGQVVEVDQVRNGWLHVKGQGWISAQSARRN